MKLISPWLVAAGICLVDLGMTIPIWAGDSPGKIEFTETEVVKVPAGCAVAVRTNGEGWLFQQAPARKVIASADNSNYAYVRQEGEKAFVVTANATWPVKGFAFTHFASGFSLDGKRLAYLELAEKPKRGWILGDPPPYRLYVNGAQVASIQKWEPLSVYYSADGKRLAFVEQIESGVIEALKRSVGVRAVVDGKPGPQFEDISDFSFSSSGKRYAYLAKARDGLRVVVDGKQEGEPLTELYAGVVFSKDDQHFAYSGKNAKGENHVFVDGKSAKRLGNQPLGLQYDPLGRLSFVARVNGRSLLVRGDSGSELTFKVPATHETGCRPSILFSPDGKRFGFMAVLKQYGGLTPVIDGREYSYSGLTKCLTFSEDSRHFGFLTVSKTLVINGVAAKLPEMPVEGSSIHFDTKGGFDVLVYKDDSVVRLSGKCPDPPAPIEMKPVEIKPGDLEAVEPVRTIRPGRR